MACGGELLRRPIRNLVTDADLGNGKRKDWRRCLLSRDSILIKAVKSYTQRRQVYLSLLKQSNYADLRPVDLRSPQAVQRWLREGREGREGKGREGREGKEGPNPQSPIRLAISSFCQPHISPISSPSLPITLHLCQVGMAIK